MLDVHLCINATPEHHESVDGGGLATTLRHTYKLGERKRPVSALDCSGI